MKFRGAISGFGQVAARGHLAGWRMRPEVEIVAVHEPVAERRHEALRLIPGVRVYESLELMLAGERLDFVDIASPPAYHLAAARAALEAGAHLMVEKPLCLRGSDLAQLVAIAARRGRVLFCAHNWKYAPAYKLAGEMVRGGRLGEIRHIALNRLRTKQAGGSQWRVNRAIGGGGIVVDHGWHVFYLMRWLMGGAAPLSVSAMTAPPASRGVEEVADIRLVFEAGRTGSSHLSWRAPLRRTSALIYGSEAALEIEGERVTLTTRAGATRDLRVKDIADDSYHSAWFGGLAEEFERAVAGGPESAEARINLDEARTALAVMNAAYRSAESGGAAVAARHADC